MYEYILPRFSEVVNSTFSSEVQRQKYIRYAESLIKLGLPPLFSFAHIAEVLNLSKPELYDLTFRTSYHYTSFYIPKRTGGARLITAPHYKLSMIQKWISDNILAKISVFGDEVVGYVKGKSILQHVHPHTNAECLLKLDIEDFFPSITTSYVTQAFANIGYSLSVSRTLAALVTLDGSLPQGACTSPQLSNLRMSGFDNDVIDFCKVENLTFTRYADDIVISGGANLPEKIADVRNFFSCHGLRINNKKTKLYRNSNQVRFVTGLMIQNGKVRLPKAMRRHIRAECHALIGTLPQLLTGKRTKPDGPISNEFLRDPISIERVIGKLNYWLQIEPEHTYPLSVKRKLLSAL